ncbi:MAG: J domain-containing protein [Bacillota bacterium]
MAVKYQDYYKILGVERNASEKDIRNAYRKLARKHHPDLQPPEKKETAEKEFKMINEAYEVLRDKEKRSRYDRLGANWEHGDEFNAYRQYQQGQPGAGWGQNFGGGFENFTFSFGDERGGGSFSEFFESIFGGGFGGGEGRTTRRARRPRRGLDVEAELEVTLEEIYTGREKQIQFSLQDLCAKCGGTGQLGNGFCSTCGGSGHVSELKTIKLKVPRDARNGKKIRLKGQGGDAEAGGERGDLYLKVKVQPHPRFTLNGDDLETKVTVYPWQAVLGDRIKAPTLEGTVRVTLPPRTHNGHRVRLRGKGMPRKDGGYGDLYLQVIVDIPGEIEPQAEELYRKLAEITG